MCALSAFVIESTNNLRNDPLLDRTAVCIRLGVSLSTLKRRETGDDPKLKPIRIGKRIVRYRASDVLEYEEKCMGGTNP
jgi:predicted DNA-binding transcriptional regulator AlpA